MFRKMSTSQAPAPVAATPAQHAKQAAEDLSKLAQQSREAVGAAIQEALEQSSSSKKKGEEPTVVQHEGWLFKRGAGYQGPPASGNMDKRPSNLSPESLAKSASSSLPPPPPPAPMAAKPPSKLFSLLQGSAEKRRYFMLVTTRAKAARNADGADANKGGPMAELRYYEKGRPESSKVKPKGSIILTADMQLQTEDNSILLVTPSRIFYLRPDVPLDQASSAKARTSLSQWLNAIEFALSGLRAWELEGAAGNKSNPHPMGDRRSLRAVDIDPNRLKKEQRKSRRNEMNPLYQGKDLLDFCELWALHGIESYDRIVAHFGPVQTDLARLKDHLTSRSAQTKAELAVLEESVTHSKEIVVKEQKTIGDVQRELHRTGQRQTLSLREFADSLDTQILPALSALQVEIGRALEAVVQMHTTAKSYVDQAKRHLAEASDKVDRLIELQNVNSVVSQEQEINDARKERRDASQTLIITETKHAESISKAMKQLEDLERSRLQGSLVIFKQVCEAESRLLTRIINESSDESILTGALNALDPAKDIRASFQLLKRAAEKSRPTGRHRKKNSLMNTADFAGLSLDEA